MSFEDDLREQDMKTDTADVDVLINGTVYRLRFLQLSGMSWTTEADKHPARPDAAVDRRYGYNLRDLCFAVAKVSGRRIQESDNGEILVELTDQQWEAIFRLPGADVGRVCDTIWSLNEFSPDSELTAAKKAAAARSELTSDSPSNSASPSAV